jgi:hypothetical protein
VEPAHRRDLSGDGRIGEIALPQPTDEALHVGCLRLGPVQMSEILLQVALICRQRVLGEAAFYPQRDEILFDSRPKRVP